MAKGALFVSDVGFADGVAEGEDEGGIGVGSIDNEGADEGLGDTVGKDAIMSTTASPKASPIGTSTSARPR